MISSNQGQGQGQQDGCVRSTIQATGGVRSKRDSQLTDGVLTERHSVVKTRTSRLASDTGNAQGQ